MAGMFFILCRQFAEHLESGKISRQDYEFAIINLAEFWDGGKII